MSNETEASTNQMEGSGCLDWRQEESQVDNEAIRGDPEIESEKWSSRARLDWHGINDDKQVSIPKVAWEQC